MAYALVLPLEVRIFVVERQGGELPLVDAKGEGERLEPGEGLTVQPDLTPHIVPLEFVENSIYPLGRRPVERATPRDILARRPELLDYGSDRVLDDLDGLYPATIAHLVFCALPGEEVPHEASCARECHVREQTPQQVQNRPHPDSRPVPGRTSPRRMDHIEYPPLYPYLLRGDQDLFVLPVLRPQPHLRALAVQPLDSYRIPIPEQRDDHRAVRQNLVFFHHQEIPILYPGPHHALPHNPQEITPPSGTHREQFRSQRVGLVTERHRLEATTGGDPAKQSHVAHRLPTLPRQPERPRTPPHPHHISFFLQPAKVVVYGLRTTQTNSSPDLTHTRRRALHTRPPRKVA